MFGGLLFSDDTDHLPILSILSEPYIDTDESRYTVYRDKSDANVAKFRDRLNSTHWHDLRDFNDPKIGVLSSKKGKITQMYSTEAHGDHAQPWHWASKSWDCHCTYKGVLTSSQEGKNLADPKLMQYLSLYTRHVAFLKTKLDQTLPFIDLVQVGNMVAWVVIN